MTIKKIFLLGNNLLRKQSEIISFPLNKKDEMLLQDLSDTLANFKDENGFGRGIAAPQIGCLKKVICINMTGEKDKFFINPQIVSYSLESEKLFDDCFSLPNIIAHIYRSKKIQVEYYDELGNFYQEEFSDDWAELLQHEIDHLDGILAIDRVRSLRDIWSRAEYLDEHSNS
jgi:peptide deformylase